MIELASGLVGRWRISIRRENRLFLGSGHVTGALSIRDTHQRRVHFARSQIVVWHGAEAGGLIDVDARTVLRRNPAGHKHKRQCHQHVRSHDSSLAVLSSETTARAEDRAFWERADVNLYFLEVSNRGASRCIEVHQDSGTTAILM